jgi:dihydrodipicolinate synthase/N-acetylneuraminate lyase
LIRKISNWQYGIIWSRRGSHLSPKASDSEVAKGLYQFAQTAIDNGIPFGVYSISTVDGAPLTAESVVILNKMLGKEGSQYLVAIKITESDFESSTIKFLNCNELQNKKIVQGWDSFYKRALQAGLLMGGRNRCGATSSAAACMVKAFNQMYIQSLAKNWEEVEKIQNVVTTVFLSMQGEDKTKFPDLQIAKKVMGLGDPLTEERTIEEAENLIKTIERLANNPDTEYGAVLVAQSLLLMGKDTPYCSPVYERLERIR